MMIEMMLNYKILEQAKEIEIPNKKQRTPTFRS